jgi:hypothetical protein
MSLTNRCSCRLRLRAESGAYALVITFAAWLWSAAQLNSMLDATRQCLSLVADCLWLVYDGHSLDRQAKNAKEHWSVQSRELGDQPCR